MEKTSNNNFIFIVYHVSGTFWNRHAFIGTNPNYVNEITQYYQEVLGKMWFTLRPLQSLTETDTYKLILIPQAL